MKTSLLLLLLYFSFPPLVFADIAWPTTTQFFFEKNGAPFTKAVGFTINCYGYSYSPMNQTVPKFYLPKEVYSMSATCQEYGCKIPENYYLNYRKIDYCSLYGKAEGKEFKIDKYGVNPIDFSLCKDKGMSRECSAKFNILEGVSSGNVFSHLIDSVKCFFGKISGRGC